MPSACVVTVARNPSAAADHEAMSRAVLARRLAGLLGYAFAGEYDPGARCARTYFVPQDTLDREAALRLRIESAADLYGGVVPSALAATKAITHGVLPDARRVPLGWPRELGARLRNVVLRGYTAYALDDARRAARLLLEHGRVRIKPAHLLGGVGQHVAADAEEADAALARLDARELHDRGVVIEQNVEAARTCSVGSVEAAGLRIAYVGSQRVTPNHRGREAYGGSDLQIVRGSISDLLECALSPPVNLAVWQALAYDRVVSDALPGLIASRRNYDVLQGCDAEGRAVSGVLEQSWRIGGASAAEIAALQSFHDDASIRFVRAATREVYGEVEELPDDAALHYDGTDAHAGRLVKYSQVLERSTQPHFDA